MSDDQLTKLSEKIDKGFKATNAKLSKHDNMFEVITTKLSDHDKTFERFFTYMEEFRAEFKQHQELSHQEHADIRGAIVDLAGQIKDYHQELLMLSRKVDRLEQAIMHIAQETGVKLRFKL